MIFTCNGLNYLSCYVSKVLIVAFIASHNIGCGVNRYIMTHESFVFFVMTKLWIHISFKWHFRFNNIWSKCLKVKHHEINITIKVTNNDKVLDVWNSCCDHGHHHQLCCGRNWWFWSTGSRVFCLQVSQRFALAGIIH